MLMFSRACTMYCKNRANYSSFNNGSQIYVTDFQQKALTINFLDKKSINNEIFEDVVRNTILF